MNIFFTLFVILMLIAASQAYYVPSTRCSIKFCNGPINQNLYQFDFKLRNTKLSPENNKNDDMVTFIFGKDGEFSNDLRRNKVDPVRFVLYTSLAASLALGANFIGVTSILLSNSPASIQQVAQNSRVDQLYSISGFKRYYNSAKGYEFVFPDNWLTDQSIVLAEARERELPEAIRLKRQREVSQIIGYTVSITGLLYLIFDL